MSLKRKFIRFVLPSIASMLVFNLYTMVDGIFIANMPETALAAVNLAMPFINFMFAFFSAAVDRRVDVDFNPSRRGANGAGKSAVFDEYGGAFGLGVAHIGELRALCPAVGGLSGSRQRYAELCNGVSPDYRGFGFFFIVSYSFEVLIKADGFPQLQPSAYC